MLAIVLLACSALSITGATSLVVALWPADGPAIAWAAAAALYVQGAFTLFLLGVKRSRVQGALRALFVGGETAALIVGTLAVIQGSVFNVFPRNGDYEWGPMGLGAFMAAHATVGLAWVIQESGATRQMALPRLPNGLLAILAVALGASSLLSVAGGLGLVLTIRPPRSPMIAYAVAAALLCQGGFGILLAASHRLRRVKTAAVLFVGGETTALVVGGLLVVATALYNISPPGAHHEYGMIGVGVLLGANAVAGLIWSACNLEFPELPDLVRAMSRG